jgi:hypothetical protein
MTASPDDPKPRSVRTLRCLAAGKVALLVALFSVAALQEARHLQSLTDPGVWLPLRMGNWILDNHSFPHSGLLSRSDGLDWSDPNWGSQVLLATIYRIIGLRAIPVMQMVIRVLIAVVMFLLAGGRRGGFWFAIILSLSAQLVMFGASNQFLLLNAILLSVELWALLSSRTVGRQGLLSWIPLLVLFWANLDWHFVFGLVTLFLFLTAAFVEQTRGIKTYAHPGAHLALSRMTLIAIASCAASLLSPASYHSYAVAWQNLFGDVGLALSPELKPMNFRTPSHYLLMLLAMFAFFVLGRQQARDVFKVMSLAVGVSVGFAFQSETWIIAVVSVAILGDGFFPAKGQTNQQSRSPKFGLWAVTVIVLIVLGVSASRIPSRADILLGVTATKLPVRSCDFIRQNHLPRPIFNELSWGGFLTWYLPDYPVSMDERHELYGEENLKSYYQAATGRQLTSEYPALTSANTFLLSPENGLARIPQMYPDPQAVFQAAFPGFHEVYRDKLAVVFSNQK